MNSPIAITNWTTGLPLMVTGFSVTRAIAQTFATASLTLKKPGDVRLQDEIDIALPVEYAFSGIVTGLGFNDSNIFDVSLESYAGIMARSDAEPTDWTNNTARDLIEGVAGEFGFKVVFDPLINPDIVPAGIAIDCGTRALSAITDLCHRNGWILLDDPNTGALYVTVVGSVAYTIALVRGIWPTTSITMTASDQRIKTTRFNRQIPGRERRGKTLIKDVDIWGEAVDTFARAGTRRYSRSDTAVNEQELGYLAAATALSEGAGGISITAQVSGFFAPDGGIWQPNKMITVIDPENQIDMYPALIESVTMTQTADESQKTTLTLVPPAKYLSGDGTVSGSVLVDPYVGLRVFR